MTMVRQKQINSLLKFYYDSYKATGRFFFATKILKVKTHKINTIIVEKWNKLKSAVMHPKDPDGVVNSVDSEQTVPSVGV